MRTERREIIERFLDRHPRIKGDVIRHIGQAAFDFDFFFGRIEAEDADGAIARPQQVEQAFHRSRLAVSVAPNQPITPARPDDYDEMPAQPAAGATEPAR